ncbi:MAG: sulfur oxidation c-type cytochrome SoxX [Rhodospirillales bacterium]|nr:MAG: sulfur oxidation c-type cytochrome SoxX [Rhodospirillales bacterium]
MIAVTIKQFDGLRGDIVSCLALKTLNHEAQDRSGPGQWEETLKAGQNLIPILGAIGLLVGVAFVSGSAVAEDLVKFSIKDNNSIPTSLTGQAGDAENGLNVAIHRQKGNCLACHVMPIPDQPFHGAVGPDLTGVGSRYDVGELRLRVVNSKYVNPDTIMPAFYAVDGLHRVLDKFQGKPMLTAQEVEDVVAYLATLKE